ncbi:FCD domain-containing protein [Thalassobaculum sp.]|uniref:GntR family transcriptional regulator n=1 Tax=Thalassobaculum sp. TaxID=2022740 RepID=UPI0032EBE285
MPSDVGKPFHAREFATLTTRVQQEIERRILTAEIKAGERIGEAALAESLGVSRGPVREAMRGLERAGLVEINANRGAIVRSIGLDEVAGLYALRGAIFALACECVARRRTDAILAKLLDQVVGMEEAVANDALDTYYRMNVEFHATILELSGNARARSTYEGIVKEMHLFRRRGLSKVPNIASSLAEHRTIIEAIDRGDPAAAREAGRYHVEQGCKRFLGTLGAAGGESAQETSAEPAASDRMTG